MPTPTKECERLVTMTNEDFRRVVDADIRNQAAPRDYDCLRNHPTATDRWYSTLVGMKKSVENQFSAKESETKAVRADLESRGDHDGSRQVLIEHLKWKSGVTKFKTGLEEKLAEASWRRRQGGSANLAEMLRSERNLLAQRNIVLKNLLMTVLDGIDDHRENLDDDDVFSKDDLELWELARKVRERVPPGDYEASLT
jgi:hypothetical protein